MKLIFYNNRNMKKTKKLITSLSSLALTPTAVAPIITSCSSNDSGIDDSTVKQIKDETVQQFKDLTVAAPHYSNIGEKGDGHNQKAIKAYYKGLVEGMGLTWVEQDDGEGYEGNAYFDIPASNNGKDMKPIILQGHMDMVYKNVDTSKDKHDVKIELVDETINGERVIHSKDYKTTIGADDGIGIATMLALAKNKDKFKHGLIRCLFTTDEEPGLIGAEHIPHGKDDTDNWFLLDPKNKNSQRIEYLLNLDNEDLKTLVVASMGGSNNNVSLNLTNGETTYVTKSTLYPNVKYFTFAATGFQGGHTGSDYSKGRTNPFTILVDAIDVVRSNEDMYKTFHLVDISSPNDSVSNAIPTGGSITFGVEVNSEKTKEKIETEIRNLQTYEEEVIKNKYPGETSAKLDFKYLENDKPDNILQTTDSNHIFDFIDHLACGIFIPESVAGYYTTSNYAPVTLKINESGSTMDFFISIYARSYNKEILNYLKFTIEDNIGRYYLPYGEENIKYDEVAYYDPWYPEPGTNKMEDVVTNAYKQIGISNPEKTLIAGGLELSWWYAYNDGMHLGTIGPELSDPHDVKESVKVDSIDKVIKMTVYCINNI